MAEGSDETIDYNENYGTLKIKDDTLSKMFGINKNTTVYEKDFSINQLNRLKEKGNLTTLTPDDIDTLYFFYEREINNPVPRCRFEEIPLKILFRDIDSNKIIISNLMSIAYTYKNSVNRGLPKPNIVENFITPSKDYWWFKLGCICALIILIFIHG